MKEKRKNLCWYDIVFTSLILFGGAIWDSTVTFLTTSPEILAQGTEFTTLDNIYGIVTEVVELTIVFVYLKLRKFDFSQWKYKITGKSTIYAIALFLLLSVLLDCADILVYGWAESTQFIGQGGFFDVLAEIDFSLILFSLLNGFYEEIFFLGICTSVKDEQRIPVFIYSLIVRTSFHTYQGLVPALEIGIIIGIVYYFAYRKKNDNLYLYMTSHALADVFGVGIIPLL